MPAPITRTRRAPQRGMLKDAPELLRPYLFHGIFLDYAGESIQVKGDCPFCSRENHFVVSRDNGMFRCLVCGEGAQKGGGNAYTFIRLLHKVSFQLQKTKTHGDQDLATLAANRGLDLSTLRRWGVCKSIIDGEWLLPAYNWKSKIANLYRYTSLQGSMKLLGTPSCKPQLFGLQFWNGNKEEVRLSEGPWDAMAQEEVAASTQVRPDGTVSPVKRDWKSAQTMFATTNFLGVAGINGFNEAWTDKFRGKTVTLMFDNDHPKEHPSGEMLPPAAYEASRRITGLLANANPEAYRPDTIQYLSWGPEGYDPSLPDHHDVRDVLHSANGVKARVAKYLQLLKKVVTVPTEWLDASNSPSAKKTEHMEPIPCTTFAEVRTAWRKALQWTPLLDQTLIVMLSVCTSTQQQGDQIWLRVLGPPGSAKTTLLRGIEVARNHVQPLSIFRGVHSGYTGGDKNKEGNLIERIDGMTVTMKDGDTLLQTPNLNQVLSEWRDLFDGHTTAIFRNKEEYTFDGHRSTWIVCGTRTLRKLNRSSAGERFLDVVIYDRDTADKELDQEILRRAAFAARRHVRANSNSSPESQVDARKGRAMGLTGGYVNWLREDTEAKLEAVEFPDDRVEECIIYGEFVANMRARPDKTDDEEDEQEVELATRLSSQFVRLANCAAVVLNKPLVDEECMLVLRKVVADSSRGVTRRIVGFMYEYEEVKGVAIPKRVLTNKMNCSEGLVNKYLRFMLETDMIVTSADAAGAKKLRYQLSPTIKRLATCIIREE